MVHTGTNIPKNKRGSEDEARKREGRWSVAGEWRTHCICNHYQNMEEWRIAVAQKGGDSPKIG